MSTVVLERRTRPRPAPPAARGIPAHAVERVTAPADLDHFFGLQMIQTHVALCHPEIEAGDCIEVDFDRREIRHDGLYMITIRHDDGAEWHGARRFQFRPAAAGWELWGFDIGAENWAPMTPGMQSRLTVHGEVREVYKPASKLRRAAA
ncbi:hypothetical protein [Acidovorax sp. K2F]|uniref:hypothetical protein n=1 Tax=Acidovorax sp. K2F TaxID=2978125 RepID=UPI0021B13B86|nr:hypothetical protein [Acidovorax sp. K2F]MCT6720639.1 hypothetical protein [Acidovorax sp. K2F]